ncbi:hypothetical protein [Streptomyces chattanoogensis]|uniref:Uncharacterized protein n=1 Tax=Streptomyces chattanoogensis TaxID=66876 RepID=A0A0N0GZC7_9ACTN|nr:hypothetical protein [Streptomyces chattanoogensis]KPC62641.1 hypothetical protein ADL29_17990 [Streptomyces chattanoogensis]
MPSKPPPPVTQAPTALDHRIEAAVGHGIDQLWEHRDRELLDGPRTRLVDAHHALVKAETSVTYFRVLLNRLSSGEFPVDKALFERIDRTVGQLEDAAADRDLCQTQVVAALEPIEAARRDKPPHGAPELPAPDLATLLAIAQGAKLHEHLLTQRLSVVTASGARVPYSQLQRLEEAGLVVRDTSHPVHAGQPVTLTDTGRTVLATPHSARPPATAPVLRPGAWPAPSHARR